MNYKCTKWRQPKFLSCVSEHSSSNGGWLEFWLVTPLKDSWFWLDKVSSFFQGHEVKDQDTAFQNVLSELQKAVASYAKILPPSRKISKALGWWVFFMDETRRTRGGEIGFSQSRSKLALDKTSSQSWIWIRWEGGGGRTPIANNGLPVRNLVKNS